MVWSVQNRVMFPTECNPLHPFHSHSAHPHLISGCSSTDRVLLVASQASASHKVYIMYSGLRDLCSVLCNNIKCLVFDSSSESLFLVLINSFKRIFVMRVSSLKRNRNSK